MLGLVSGAALLLVAGKFNIDVGVVAEGRVGKGPLQAGQSPTAGVVGVMTPDVGVEFRRLDLDLRLDYGLRIFWREPNGTSGTPSRLEPLFLHIANLYATGRPTETVTLTGTATAVEGEPDYSYLAVLLGPQTPGMTTPPGGTRPQGALPTVVRIFSVSSRVGALVALSRIWEIDAAVEGDHRRPLGDTVAADGTSSVVLPRQSGLRVEPTAIAHLSRRDDLLLLGRVGYQTYSSTSASQGGDFLAATVQAGWRTRLSLRYDLRVLGGVANLRTLARRPALMAPSPPPASATANPGDSAFRPSGSAEIQGRLFRRGDIALNGSLGVTAEYTADPILAVVVPHGTLYTVWTLIFAPDWTAGLEGAFGTSLSPSPIQPPPVPPQRSPIETSFAITLPVRHRVSEGFNVEFGVRWADRAPHLRAVDFGFYQRDLWAYVMLTATSRQLPRGSSR